MAKGVTSKSRNKDEENKRREEQQKPHSEQKQTTQKQKPGQSKPQNETPATSRPATQEVAPKPTSTQIPTLEPKYASAEQIEEARDFGRKSLEMARAGQLDMSEKIPFTQGVRGYAEQYRIPELEDYQANYDTSSDVYRAPAGDDSSRRPANAPYADKTWLKSRRGNAEEGAVPILGSRRGYAEAPVEENYDPSRLSASDQRRLRAIDKDIERLSGRYNNPEIQRRLEGLQAERDRITGQHLMSDDTDMSELIDTWLDNDYEMSDTEIEQAKQIIRDYENNEYKNSNIYDLTDEESAKLSQINALRDKVSKPEAAVYGTMNATPGVSALMAAGDNDFYGWSLDQLRDEVARQRDIPMSAETRDYVNQLQQRIASYQDLMQNPDTIYSTGDVGVDDISGANTPFKNSAEVQRAINETETQMYKLMLESMRGDQSDYDKYSFRKANAQKQNPVQYNTADLLTRGLESAAIQGAMGSNGLLADIATDMLTDTGAEYIANKAGGMSNVDASNRAFGSAIGNIGLDVGINAAPGIINGIVERRLQRLRDQIPTIEDDVIEAALRQTDEVPTVEAPTQAAKQAEPEAPAMEAPTQPAEQAAETAVRQAPTRQPSTNPEAVENDVTGATTTTDLSEHFNAENNRVNDFMNKTRSGSIEMENGQIIERYSLKDMKSQIREFKQNGSVPADTTIAVRYNDGSIKVYGEGDDLSDLKLNNVSGVIYDNGSTSAFAGRGVKVNNYNELYNDWGEDDWRLDFTDANDVPASNVPLTGEVETPTVAEQAADDSVNIHDHGTGERKVESHRANTMNKSPYTTEQNSPTENYEYNVWGREAQTEMGHQRWDDNPNAIGELANKEYWDAADARFAHDRWTELMEKGDPESIRQAGRLSRKQSYEMREGGRLIQTNVDAEADTVAGQFNQARQLINKAVDTHRGAGTSEALDNFITQLENRLQKEGLLDYNLQFFGEGKERRIQIIQEMLDEGMGAYAPTNKNIGSRDFSGVNKILSQLESGKIKDMESLTKAIYRQNGGANISAENQKKIFDYLTEASKLQEGTREQEVLLAKAARLAMQDVPVSFGKKIRSILYTNMLGNFKTAVSRNALGNAAYNLLEQTRHPLAAGIDALTSVATGKRSTLGWNLDKFKAYGRGFAKGASDQAKDIAQRVNTGRNGSMGWVNALKENSTIWRENTDNKVRNAIGKLANNANFYVSNAMEMGDRPFFEANFEQRRVELQQLLERFGKQGVAGFDKIPDEAIDDTINMMAAIHAADAVFQKQGRMSMGLSKMREGLADMSRGAIGIDLLSSSATPFTMTPGNMLEKAIEYSPIGVVKNAAETISELSRGQFNQRRFVDEASRNIMSIPMLGGAYAVAKRGGINGGYSEDPDEKSAQMSDDFIEYGLNVPDAVPLLGGKTLNTADIPVLASILQTAGAINEKGLNADSLKQAAEAILLGSTMQGFRRLFGSDTAYNSSLSDSFINTVASAGNQLIPSLVRQTAQTTDEYKRDLGEYGTGQYYLNQIKNSTPGWRETLPIKYDTEGNPVLQNQGRGIGSKILENYVLPMQVSEYEPSELNTEASRLKQDTEGHSTAGFVPYAKRSDLRDWDASLETPIEYTEEQFYNYKRDLGTLNSNTATQVIHSDLYRSLDDEDKVNVLSDVYSAMKQVAKYNATEIGTDNKLANAYMDDGIDGFMERLEAKYNQYGLDPDAYIEMKTNGEDMTPFEGYKEAQEAVGIGDSATARKFWLDGQATGQGPESLQDYKDYSDALKEYDMSASDKAWAAFEANGADGIAALKEQRDTAFDTGFVSSDGKVNTQAYEKAVSVLGDNPDVLDGYTSFKSDITEKGYTTQEQYIPYVQNLSGLSNEQKGQYIMLYAGKTPTEDSLGKNAWAAYDSAGYNGYYLYKSLQEVKDYNGDDKRNKYDRIQQLYDWGYDQTTDMYQLLVDLKY